MGGVGGVGRCHAAEVTAGCRREEETISQVSPLPSRADAATRVVTSSAFAKSLGQTKGNNDNDDDN